MYLKSQTLSVCLFSLHCLKPKKSLQIALTILGTICSSPVNSLVKKVCVSLGSDAISFKSSSGAQAMPTENMLIPLKIVEKKRNIVEFLLKVHVEKDLTCLISIQTEQMVLSEIGS